MRITSRLAAAAATLGLLAACGTSQPSATERDDERASEAADGGGPIILTDADGRTVELPGPAKDVVILEWHQIEVALTLGVTPVAVADPDGYRTWDTAEDLPDDVPDVGMRGEPNPNAVLEVDPDLIIIEGGGGDLERFEKYDVPVLVTRSANAEDPIAQMKDTFNLIAQALGKEDEAEDVLAEFDAALEEGREAMADAAPEVTDFVYADAYVAGSTLSIRPFGQGSIVGEIGEELGLTNVWDGEVDPEYGLGQTDIEGLAAVQDAWLFYTGTEDESWRGELEGNSLWTNSSFVREDRVVAFDDGIWTFGGPRSGEQLIDEFVAAVGA